MSADLTAPGPAVAITDQSPRAIAGPRQVIVGPDRSAVTVTAIWFATRVAVLATLTIPQLAANGDAKYYFQTLDTLMHGGSLQTAFREYPVAVLSVLFPQYMVSGVYSQVYLIMFCLSMMAFDALLTAALWRRAGRRMGPAVWFWIAFLPALGNMVYFRFDLVPGVLVALAILFVAGRPALAGAATAVAAAFKLWPAVLLAPLALAAGRRRVLGGFAVAGGLAAITSLWLAGLGRTLSPLTWQSDRGLQIESISASPLLLLRRFAPGDLWDIHQSQYTAFEIFGPGVHELLMVSTLLTVLGAGVLGWLWLRAKALGNVPVDLLATLLLATILMMVISNKTLSPQYLIWVGAPIAALLALNPTPFARRAGWLMLAISVLTQYEFPFAYPDIISGQDFAGTGVLTLVVRNGLLCWLTYLTCREVYRRTRPPTTDDELGAVDRWRWASQLTPWRDRSDRIPTPLV